MVSGIINVEELGLSDIYLKMTDDVRYQACVKVIEQAMRSINQTDDVQIKKQYINTILEKSISHYVKEEEYESAQLLADIKEVLNQKY